MHPMSFEEFLWATGDVVTMTLLKKAFNAGRALGVETNRHIMRKFRLYMLIGGMRQAVSNYLENNNLKYVDQTKRDILSLYKEDFYKIDPTGKVSHLFEAIPSELNRHSSRYQVSSVFPNHRVTTLAEEFSELIGSKTVLASYFSTDPNTGLAAHKDNSRFRLYLSDTGLLITSAKDRKSVV